MSWRSKWRRRLVLLGLAVGAILLQWILEETRKPVRQRDYEIKLEAAQKADEAFASVRRFCDLEDAIVDLANDPSCTGLIGPETSLITNAYGNLESKLTTLNPNMAAYVVELFKQAGLREGDLVAVAASGSFPGMNIAVYAAMEVMGLRPIITTSVGASNWGATDPDFTWLDMERLFESEGIFGFRSIAASHGGGDDMGRGLSPLGRQKIVDAMHRNEVAQLSSSNLEDAIVKRMALYEEESRGRLYRGFVNVGGGLAAIGSSQNRSLIPPGLSLDLVPKNWPRKGCLILMAEKGVPVIQLLSMSELAGAAGLPLAPEELPVPGEGGVFIKNSYRLSLAFLFFLLYSALCVFVLAPEIRQGVFDRVRGKVDGDAI